MKNIEFEIRSFVTDEEYDRLKSILEKEADFIKEDEQTTLYFSGDKDLRIQKNNAGGKIWYKSGEIHEEAREEIEVKISSEDFEKAKKLFENLEYEVEIMWLRHRLQYQMDEIKITLDNTKGYGKILELEIVSGEENKEEILQALKDKMKELKIEMTPKEEFANKFEYYKENWRKLI